MLPDRWLDRWIDLARERAVDTPVLEIGCGSGHDTSTLVAAGLRVIAFDLSADAVAKARQRVPGATIEQRDVRDRFPIDARDLGVIVASLSLHYFPWNETLDMVRRIRETLRPGGMLLCRLNSTEDNNFGAIGHREIEPNFYEVDGTPKRFFDETAVRALFANGWHIRAIEHIVTRKYVLAKALWEVIVEREISDESLALNPH
jgi:SAM-dependent methyltransferase